MFPSSLPPTLKPANDLTAFSNVFLESTQWILIRRHPRINRILICPYRQKEKCREARILDFFILKEPPILRYKVFMNNGRILSKKSERIFCKFLKGVRSPQKGGS